MPWTTRLGSSLLESARASFRISRAERRANFDLSSSGQPDAPSKNRNPTKVDQLAFVTFAQLRAASKAARKFP